jgi:replicative DNA helicase
VNDIEWQDGALYSAVWGGANDLFTIVSVDDFDPGYRQELAELIHRGTVEEPDSLRQFVTDEAQKRGKEFLVYVMSVVTSGFTGTARYYGEKVRDASRKRSVSKVLAQGLDRLSKDWSPDEVMENVLTDLATMPKPASSDDDTWTLADLMGLQVEHEPFTLPKMLKRNERMVLTGSEGGGKSVFVYQLLTGAAFGVDTFTLERTEPKRVLFLDVENNEFQARSNLDKIVPTLKEIAPDADPDWRSMKRRVVDLLASKDRTEIVRRVLHYSPDILYMGTAYKLTDVSDETHRSVRAIQSVVDRIRQEINCTVIVEHHAGHGHMNDRNNMRPEGSSYWLRWPDFGYGMQPLPTQGGQRLMRLGAWRGDRATDREFPVAVKQSSVMPWAPVYADEWEAVYADRYEKN